MIFINLKRLHFSFLFVYFSKTESWFVFLLYFDSIKKIIGSLFFSILICSYACMFVFNKMFLFFYNFERKYFEKYFWNSWLGKKRYLFWKNVYHHPASFRIRWVNETKNNLFSVLLNTFKLTLSICLYFLELYILNDLWKILRLNAQTN